MSLNGYRDSDELLQNFYSDIISENGLYYLYDDEGKVIYDGYTYSYHENGTVDTFSLTNYAVTFKVVSYDGEGRMLRAEKDNQGSEYYTYTYDENGRLIRRYNGGVDNPEEITYIYDDNGRLIRMKSTYYMQFGYTIENTYPYRYVDMTGTILSDGGAAVSGGRYVRQIGWIYAPNAKR